MSGDGEGEGGSAHEEEAPSLADLWGYDPYKKQADSSLTVHDSVDIFNDLNKAHGWTAAQAAGNSAASSAVQADHLAENARLMGNDDIAAKFAARSSVLDAASENRGMLNAVMENPAMKIGGNVAGLALGGLTVAQGIGEWQHGNKTQGGMDMVAGGAGVAAGGLGLASALGAGGLVAAAAPIAAPIALAAGLAAMGNGFSKEHGWWGKNADGTNRDSLQFVGQNTSNAYNAVNKWAGGGVMGGIAGGIAGGATALGTGAVALGGDLVGGVAAVGQGLGSLGSMAGKGLWNGAKWLGNGVGNVAGAVGNGIGNAASAVGHGVANVAGAVGNGIGNAAHAVGSGVSNAAHAVGNFVSHLW